LLHMRRVLMHTSPVNKPRSMVRRIFRVFAVLAMLGILGVGALLGSLCLEHRTQVTLPTPTGPFAVGRALYDWVDDKTLDTLAPVQGTKRELLVWIWYPAMAGQSAAMMDLYVPASLRAPAPPGGDPHFSLIQRLVIWVFRLLTRDSSKVRSHSVRDA